jgi:hypothetical protein
MSMSILLVDYNFVWSLKIYSGLLDSMFRFATAMLTFLRVPFNAIYLFTRLRLIALQRYHCVKAPTGELHSF